MWTLLPDFANLRPSASGSKKKLARWTDVFRRINSHRQVSFGQNFLALVFEPDDGMVRCMLGNCAH